MNDENQTMTSEVSNASATHQTHIWQQENKTVQPNFWVTWTELNLFYHLEALYYFSIIQWMNCLDRDCFSAMFPPS